MWWDILKNIQISGQKTVSRDYVRDDDDDDDCLKQLQKLVDTLSNQPKLSSRRYYEDTYYNTNTLCIIPEQGEGEYVPHFDFSFYRPDKWTEEELCWVVGQFMNMPDFDKSIRHAKRFGDVFFDLLVDRYNDEGMLRAHNKKNDYFSADILVGHRLEQNLQFSVTILSHKYEEIRDFIRRGLS